MKALMVALVLLLLAVVSGSVWFGVVSTGVLQEDPKVEIIAGGGTNGTLRVATDADYWPYSFLDDAGELSGREIEIANAIANRLGMNIELKGMPWEDCLHCAVQHKTDLVLTCAEYSPGDETGDLVSSLPLDCDNYMVFGKQPLESVIELKGRRLAQLNYGNVNPALKSLGLADEIQYFPSHRAAFEAIERGEADYTVIRYSPAVGILNSLDIKDIKPQCLAGRSFFCIGIDCGQPELIRKVNEAIVYLRASGEMQRLSDKWLTTYVEPDSLGEVLVKHHVAVMVFLIIIFSLIATILTLSYYRLRILRKSELLALRSKVLHRIVKSAPWMLKFDCQGRLVKVEYSEEVGKIMRNKFHTNEEWLNLVHPNDRHYAIDRIGAVMQKDNQITNLDIEYRFMAASGEYHWIRSAGRVFFNPDGSGELMGMNFDIDEHVNHRIQRQKEMEQIISKLRYEKQRIDVILDVIHAVQWSFKVSADDKILAHEFSRSIGEFVHNEEVAHTYDWERFIHPDDYEQALDAFKATLYDHSCRTPYDVTFRMIDRDGNYNWFRSAGDIFRNPDGSGEMYGIHIDVTKQRREQERLERAREEVRAKDAILSEVVKARYGYDVTVDLTTMRCAVIRGVGCEGAVEVFEQCSNYNEVVATFNRFLADKEYLKRTQALLEADSILKIARSGRRGYIDTVEYPTKSANPGEEGKIGWREVHLFIGSNSAGRPIANILGRNITAEHEQADAREKLKLAEEANRAKSEFLFNMSHDIRTPMHAIKGFADIASKNFDNIDTVKDCISKIQKSGDLLFSLLNSILDMSRIEVGRMKLEETPGDIYHSFNNVQSTMTEYAQEKSIDLTFKFGEIKNRYVYVDFEKTNRILVNLISNAIKYTKDGGYVHVACEQFMDVDTDKYKTPTGVFRYTFEDNGIGMSDEFLQHVYEQFAREENGSIGDVNGIGLGMAISKAFVDLMGGKIEVKSALNVGTTFTVTIPLRLQEKEPEFMDPETGLKLTMKNGGVVEKSDPSIFRGRRVLLVDDSMFNREVSKHYLQEAGLTVDVVMNGEDAVNKVKSQYEKGEGYDLVMMDIRMPGMNGFEAVKIIREWEAGQRHVPIIAWSANAFAEDRAAALASGMDDHIAKGVKPSVLQECIARHLKG